ncbi:MAG TPA: sigma-E factor regulatory protein RseB domain-containing protein [Planctomycetota bacterium]|nr:sigma-E factor regulatory protein RseB domain-containing protein [Planctomycetota bacterium]
MASLHRPKLRLLLLAVALGCGQGPGAPGPDGGSQLATAGAQSLLQKMVLAPSSVAYQGVRRVEAHWQIASAPQDLAYRELVSGDGQGGFAIDPLEVLQPQLTRPEVDIFQLLQKGREGFLYRYRDFRVSDLGLFLASYSATDSGVISQVAGRSCAQLTIEPRTDSDRLWRAWVDIETGLVLRAREELEDGTLVSLMEFESLSLAPDLSQVQFHVPINEELPLPETELAVKLGFPLAKPKLLPAGYQLTDTASVTDITDHRAWAKLTYGDGLEQVIFLHGGAVGAQGLTGLGADVVQSLAVGPWTVLQGQVQGQRVIAMGKVGEQALLDMVESAFF